MTHEAWTGKLDAYLDGELESGEMQELDRHLRECRECAAESLRRLQWKRTVHAAGQRYAADPALRERIQKSISRERPGRVSWRWWPAFAAPVVVLLLLVSAVMLQENARRVRNGQIVSELADLHVATLASATPVDVVSTDRHTVKPWFEGKIPFSFNLPELQGSPFELVGGRVSYLEQSPGAELIFRIRKHQISVFMFQERAVPSDFPAAQAMEARSFHLETWKQGGLRYFVIGDTSAEDLRALSALLKSAQ
jgi:anti-sigma factor RsiW